MAASVAVSSSRLVAPSIGSGSWNELESPVEDPEPVAVEEQHLQAPGVPPEEHVQVPRQRVELELALNLAREPVEALAHIDTLQADEHADATLERDHESTTSSSRRSASGSNSPTTTARPLPSTMRYSGAPAGSTISATRTTP